MIEPKSKLGFLDTDFCVKVAHWLVFFYDRDVVVFADSRTVAKEFTKQAAFVPKYFLSKALNISLGIENSKIVGRGALSTFIKHFF